MPSKPALRVLTVTDLHQGIGLYAQLGAAVTRHRPDVLALVGDVLDYRGLGNGYLSIAACAEMLAALKVESIVFVRGNHEDRNWLEFRHAFRSRGRPLVALHGEGFRAGPFGLLGFPCLLGDEQWFAAGRERLPVNPIDWLPAVLKPLGSAGRLVWLMHEPPQGTCLSAPSGPIAGNPEWTEAILAHQPRLVVCGHDHASPRRAGRWHAMIGETLVVNVGQPDLEVLHYAVIDLGPGQTPDGRAVLRVEAFPWGNALEFAGHNPG